MNHPGEGRLHDYVDGLLEGDADEEVARHLEGCGRCRARVEGIRDLTARLGDLPREIAPRRDLRPDVPDRVGEEPLRRATADSGPGMGAWLRAAAVLVALVGTGAAIWLGVLGEDAPRASPRDPVVAMYAQAAGELAREMQRRKGELTPAAARALEASLASVDGAIRELERARARERAEDGLTRRLVTRYRTKLEILRGAVKWLEES